MKAEIIVVITVDKKYIQKMLNLVSKSITEQIHKFTISPMTKNCITTTDLTLIAAV